MEVVSGDVTDPASLPSALSDASGVIFAASGKGYWSAESVDEQVSSCARVLHYTSVIACVAAVTAVAATAETILATSDHTFQGSVSSVAKKAKAAQQKHWKWSLLPHK